jgi:hypothetical protein
MARRLVYPVDLSGVEAELGKITKKLRISKADAIRRAVSYYADYVEGLEVIEMRDVGEEQAKKEILEYLRGKERVSSDEIADALRLDMSRVNEVLMKLWKEEEIVEPED